jgi:hypothetical protein
MMLQYEAERQDLQDKLCDEQRRLSASSSSSSAASAQERDHQHRLIRSWLSSHHLPEHAELFAEYWYAMQKYGCDAGKERREIEDWTWG